MNKVLIIMILGMVTGFVLRKYGNLFHYIDKIIMGTIFLLLFCLGLSVGLNDQVIHNFHLIGLNAFLLTTGAISGSVILSWVLYRLFFRNKIHEK